MDVEAYIASLRNSPDRPTDWSKKTEDAIRKLMKAPTSSMISENCRICGVGTIRLKGSRRCRGCPSHKNDDRP